uniref:Chromo domain-containing protein n=1 Tax=Amorphochlora amoebiformis TaxID=1561963 RepID=A0A7S0H8G3_9EUKA|mmetsp:Transcript_5926/g.9099  ORF Transcript_5926/g.9099 Transcript_5926/m.9099 type:complete len:425 (+) Transcript_5926:59-1333(+)
MRGKLSYTTRVFEVEKILQQRIINDDLCYLVKWKGYPDAYNTWETSTSFKTEFKHHSKPTLKLNRDQKTPPRPQVHHDRPKNAPTPDSHPKEGGPEPAKMPSHPKPPTAQVQLGSHRVRSKPVRFKNSDFEFHLDKPSRRRRQPSDAHGKQVPSKSSGLSGSKRKKASQESKSLLKKVRKGNTNGNDTCAPDTADASDDTEDTNAEPQMHGNAAGMGSGVRNGMGYGSGSSDPAGGAFTSDAAGRSHTLASGKAQGRGKHHPQPRTRKKTPKSASTGNARGHASTTASSTASAGATTTVAPNVLGKSFRRRLPALPSVTSSSTIDIDQERIELDFKGPLGNLRTICMENLKNIDLPGLFKRRDETGLNNVIKHIRRAILLLHDTPCPSCGDFMYRRLYRDKKRYRYVCVNYHKTKQCATFIRDF